MQVMYRCKETGQEMARDPTGKYYVMVSGHVISEVSKEFVDNRLVEEPEHWEVV